ncbi:MAG: flagellar biosynthesis protein FliL [Rickettsiales bacterium]|nr:flagellar biosynthesis protein FliL [Rickettsiales bacterium]|tara:strand:- start:1425 stop:2051 length:627 start_codon:yes stop_codon:yes gene_type:complete
MAEENKNNEDKKGGIVKYILFSFGGLALLGVGLGIGMFMGGDETDPSSEISQIIEKKDNPEKEENLIEDELALEDCADEEKDEEGNCPVGPKKIPKLVPEEEIFATTYYEFPGNFTTNLKNSKKFLQISLGVSTQYDERVMVNVESHQLALRSEILGTMSDFTAEAISSREGKAELAESLKNGINKILEGVEGFGGVENVHFTSFVLQ